MMNKKKKAAIIEWFKCISDFPPESLAQLQDGNHFLRLIEKLKKTDKTIVVESIEAKYKLVQECIDDYYQGRNRSIDYGLCQKGNEIHLAKVALLLLTAFVKESVQEKDDRLDRLMELDHQLQLDIRECISFVMGDGNGPLRTDFDKVLSTPTNYSSLSPAQPGPSSRAKSPRLSSPLASLKLETPKKAGRPRRVSSAKQEYITTPVESPLKSLFESPQFHQINIRKMRQELANKLHETEQERDELKSTVNEQKKKISNWEAKYNVVKRRRSSLRKKDGVMEMDIDEPVKPVVAECQHCQMYVEDLKDVRKDRDKFCSDLEQKESEVQQFKSQLDQMIQEKKGWGEDMVKLQESKLNLANENAELKEDNLNKQKEIDFHKIKRESDTQTAEVSFEANEVVVGEPMTVVEVECLKKDIEERDAKIRDRDAEIKNLQQKKKTFQKLSDDRFLTEVRKTRDLESTKLKLMSELTTLGQKLAEEEKKVREMTFNNAQQSEKIEELTRENTELENGNQNLVNQMQQLDATKSQEVELLLNKVTGLEKKTVQLENMYNQLCVSSTEEIRQLRSNLAEHENNHASFLSQKQVMAAKQDQDQILYDALWDENQKNCETLKNTQEKLGTKEEKITRLENDIQKFSDKQSSQIKELEGRLQTANERFDSMTKDRNKYYGRFEYATAECKTLRLTLNGKADRIKSLEEELSVKTNSEQSHSKEKLNLQSAVSRLTISHNQVLIERDQLRGNQCEAEREIANFRKSKEMLEQEVLKLKNNDVKNQNAMVALQRETDAIKVDLVQKEGSIAAMSCEKEKCESQLHQLKELVESLNSEIKNKNWRLQEIEQKNKEATSELTVAANRNNELTQQNEQLSDTVASLEGAKVNHESKIKEMTDRLERSETASNDMKTENINLNRQLEQFVVTTSEVQAAKSLNEQLKEEIQTLQDLGKNGEEEKKKMVKEYTAKISVLLNEKRDVNETYEKLFSAHEKLMQTHKELQAKYDRKILNKNEGAACANNDMSLETERDGLRETVDDMDREMRSNTKSKELSDKEYYMCVQEKDKKIGQLERDLAALQEEVDELKRIQDPIRRENSNLQEDKEELQSKIEWMELIKADLERRLGHEENLRDRVVIEKQAIIDKVRSKYQRAKEIVESLEKEKKSLQDQLKTTVSRSRTEWEDLQNQLEASHVKYKTVVRKLNAAQSNLGELRHELQDNVQLQGKVTELDFNNRKIQKENYTLSTQLKLVQSQLKKSIEGTKMDNSRRQTLAGVSKCFDSSDYLKNMYGVKKDVLRKVHSSSSGEPMLMQRKVTRSTSDAIIEKYCVPTHASRMSLNCSATSDGFNNHSLLSSKSHFVCADEEDFLDQPSLWGMNLDQTVAESPSVRMSELKSRNSLCPPHLRSCYPTESHLAKYKDADIREGFASKRTSVINNLPGDQPHLKRPKTETVSEAAGGDESVPKTPKEKTSFFFRLKSPLTKYRKGSYRPPSAKKEKPKKGLFFMA